MKITFAGVGSAFTTTDYYQSNMLITAASGKTLLLDCGTDIRFSLGELNIDSGNFGQYIDAIYISHIHADHVGGLEWVAFNTYFNPNTPTPMLFMNATTIDDLWNHSLRGGLKCIEGKVMHLSDYFRCVPVHEQFSWESIHFTLWKMPHVLADTENHYSYGLMITEDGSSKKTFISTDTLFQPEILARINKDTDMIFHDAETSPFSTGIHAHYHDLVTLPSEIKKKMWLYHYQPNPTHDPVKDGFMGFVTKGQEFDLA